MIQHNLILGLLVTAVASVHGGGSFTLEGVWEDVDGGTVSTVVRVESSKAPIIDGSLEAIWDEAVLLPDTWRQVDPEEGSPPSERTTVRILRDDANLYIAVECFDSVPDEIHANQMRRDGDAGGDDWVRIAIDPGRDRRTGYVFGMTAAGGLSDARVFGGRPDLDWDGLWDGRVTINEDGWLAEFIIPFQTVSIKSGSSEWGINVERAIRRNNELIRWTSSRRNVGVTSFANAGVIDVPGELDQGLGLDLKPYGKIGVVDSEGSDARTDFEGGLDLHWRLTSSLTLSGTYNTDFAETEVDERRVNLDRFELFFPEKRDFFLEDSGIFGFGGIHRSPLPFYSRRIGLSPQGEAVPILMGAKLTGTIGDLDVGFLDVQMKESATLGSKNYFVGRVRANVLDESTLGVIYTDGDPSSTGSNAVAGVDFNFKTSTFQGDQKVSAHAWLMQSRTSGDGDDPGDAWAAGLRVGYPNDEWNWLVGWGRIGTKFNPALGFAPRRGIHEFFGHLDHTWRPGSDWIKEVTIGVDGGAILDLDGDVQSADAEVDFLEIKTRRGDSLQASFGWEREVPTTAFTIADSVTIPPGDYEWSLWQVRGQTTEREPVSLQGSMRTGGYYGGSRRTFSGGFLWRPSRFLHCGLGAEVNEIDLPDSNVTTRLVHGRCNVIFSPQVEWSNFIQYDSVSETIGINSRFRWTIEPGSEMYIVFNHNVEADDLEFKLVDSELIAKVGWTIRF